MAASIRTNSSFSSDSASDLSSVTMTPQYNPSSPPVVRQCTVQQPHNTYPMQGPATMQRPATMQGPATILPPIDMQAQMRQMQAQMRQMQADMEQRLGPMRALPFPPLRSLTPPPVPVGLLELPTGSHQSRSLTPTPIVTLPTDEDHRRRQMKLHLDMNSFKPEEIKVKAARNQLQVHAEHSERGADRVSSRVYHQQYNLPEDVKLTKMKCHMSPDGVLEVEGKVKPQYRVKFDL